MYKKNRFADSQTLNWTTQAEIRLQFILCSIIDNDQLSGYLLITFLCLQLVGVEVVYLQSSDLIALIFTSNGFILLVLSTAALLFHRKALYQAYRVVLADKAKYDQAWAAIMADNDQRDQVELLANQVKLIQNLSLSTSSQSLMFQQFNRCRGCLVSLRSNTIFRLKELSVSNNSSQQSPSPSPSNSTELLGSCVPAQRWQQLVNCGIPGSLDVQRPVDSLDQLYFQAVALNPILVDKVKSWALASGGCFCLKQAWQLSTVMVRSHEYEEPPSVTEHAAHSLCNAVDASPVQTRDFALSGVIDQGLEPVIIGKALPPGFVRWEQVTRGGLLSEHAIKWGCIKSVQRSLEKSTRAYNKVLPNMTLLFINIHFLQLCISYL